MKHAKGGLKREYKKLVIGCQPFRLNTPENGIVLNIANPSCDVRYSNKSDLKPHFVLKMWDERSLPVAGACDVWFKGENEKSFIWHYFDCLP